MEVITWNSFKGFYVVSKDKKRPNGMQFHYWTETVEQCEQWIKEND